jgi:hypothetical protein
MFKETTVSKSAEISVDGEGLGNIVVEAHKNGETFCNVSFDIGTDTTTCSTKMTTKLVYQEDKDALCKDLEFAAKGILSLVEFINSSCPQLPTKPDAKQPFEEFPKVQFVETLSPEETC